MAKDTASVRMYSAPDASPRLQVPEADGTFFYTAGRILSFFPQINDNGITFFKEDIDDKLVSSLVGSLADIQHVKPGYGVSDPLAQTWKNTAFSAIVQAEKNDHGIDIVCKCEREVARAMGFDAEDFGPGKKFGKYSQECDYQPLKSTWIVVDKDDPSKVVKEVAYQEGVDAGFKLSHVGPDGNWNYFKVDGNPVYVRIKPLSFSGVGHVIRPADESAEIYKLAASLASCTKLASFFPGMDDAVNAFPAGILGSVGQGADLGPFAMDHIMNPDLNTSAVGDFQKFNEDENDPKAPDDHFAACYAAIDHGNVVNGQPAKVKQRLFRIKNDKGEYDRKRLIVAYHALAGLRGDITKAEQMPPGARAHAMALVRHGLKETLPKKTTSTKEISSKVTLEQEIESLKQREKELSNAATDADAKIAQLTSSIETLNTEKAKEISERDTKIADLEKAISEYQAKEVSASRLADLDKILAFTEDEKKADTFETFVKELASLSEDGFQIRVLQRQLAAKDAEAKAAKALASQGGGATHMVDPVKPFDASTLVTVGTDDDKAQTSITALL